MASQAEVDALVALCVAGEYDQAAAMMRVSWPSLFFGGIGAVFTAGEDVGNTIRNGAGAPGGGVGVNGDFYLDTTAKAIYGPKTGGVWGSATSLIGPTPTGAANLVLATPNGSSGVASLRALVAADLPPHAPVDASYIVLETSGDLTSERQLGTVIRIGALADRPPAAVDGRLYFVTDSGAQRWQRDGGTDWIETPISWGQVINKPSTFAPSAHTHPASDIASGTLAAALLPAATTSTQGASILATPSSDVVAGHVVQANDARLSDARAPTAHNHAASEITSGVLAMARLATGTPDGTKFVKDDGTLAVPPGTGEANTVANGKTGTTSFTAHGVLVGNGAGAVVVTGTGQGKQVFVSGGPLADPAWESNGAVYIAEANVDFTDATLAQAIVTTETLSVGNHEISVLLGVTCATAGGFKCEVSGGTATLGQQEWFAEADGIDDLETPVIVMPSIQSSAITSTGGIAYSVRIRGFARVTAAGTIMVRCAQAVSNATATTVLSGSGLTVH